MPDTGWIALGVGVATTIFWVGFFFGRQRASHARLRQRVTDLERAYAKVGERGFVSRFPADD